MNRHSTKALINKYLLSRLLLFALSTTSSAFSTDTIPFRHNKFQIDPISLLTGIVVANYECRITRTHAFAVEGFYSFPGETEKQGEGIQYRHYYSPRNFWGIFANSGEFGIHIPPMERGDTTTYSIKMSYLVIGANWGKNWYLKNRFPIIFRFGAGYPVISDLSWKNNLKPPSYASLFEGISRFAVALDSELTIGVNF